MITRIRRVITKNIRIYHGVAIPSPGVAKAKLPSSRALPFLIEFL
jgi:hypothetical protein